MYIHIMYEYGNNNKITIMIYDPVVIMVDHLTSWIRPFSEQFVGYSTHDLHPMICNLIIITPSLNKLINARVFQVILMILEHSKSVNSYRIL